MKIDMNTTTNRRGLFTGVLRYATLGLVGISGISLVAKRRRLVKENKCVNRGICSGCSEFDLCGLPQALSAKRVLGNQDAQE